MSIHPSSQAAALEGAGEMFRVTTHDFDRLPGMKEWKWISAKISLEKKQI